MRHPLAILTVMSILFALSPMGQPLWGDEAQPPVTLSDEDKAALSQQHDALVEQLKALHRQEKIKECQEVFEKIIAIERRMYGDVHIEIANSLQQMGSFARRLRDFPRAIKFHDEAEKMLSQLFGKDSTQAVDARLYATHAKALAGFSDAQLDELDKANRHFNESLAHHSQGRLVEAIKLGTEVVEIRRRILGEQHWVYARALMNMGYFHYAARDFPASHDFYAKALPVFQVRYGVHPSTAGCLVVLGMTSKNLGDIDAAITYRLKCLEMQQKLYPSDRFPNGRAEMATNLHNLGGLWRDKQQYWQARKFLGRALAMRRKLFPVEQFPDGSPSLAYTLNNLGLACMSQGKYAEARTYFDESLAMRRRLFGTKEFPHGHPALANALKTQAGFLHRVGEYEGSRAHSLEALEVYRRLYPIEKYPHGHTDLAHAILEVGIRSRQAGAYDNALSRYQEALAMLHATLPQSAIQRGYPLLASTLNLLMVIHHIRGDAEEARNYAKQALAMNEMLYPESDYPQGHPDFASLLADLSNLFKTQGDRQQACKYARLALAMNRKLYPQEKYPAGHWEIVRVLDQLGVMLFGLGRFEESRDHHLQALAMARRLDDGTHVGTQLVIAQVLNNLGCAFGRLNDNAEYERCIREALAIVEEESAALDLPQGQPQIAIYLSNLSRVLSVRGDYEEALEAQLRGRKIVNGRYPGDAFPAGHYALMWQIYWTSAILFEKGDARNALVEATRAFEMQQSLLRIFTAAAAETDAVNITRQKVDVRDLWLSQCLLAKQPPARIYEALWGNRRLVYRTLANRQQAILGELAPETAKDYQVYLQTRRDYSRVALSPMSKARDAAARRRDKLVELTRKKEDLERSLAGELPAFARQLKLEQSTAGEFLKTLPPNTAFIDVVSYGQIKTKSNAELSATREYVAFVLAGGLITVARLGDAATIDAALSAWQEQLAAATFTRPASVEGARSPADVLRELIWDKLAPSLTDQTETIFLCADGNLSALPWGALPGKQDTTVLLERYGFVLVPHGQFLLEQLQSAAPAKSELTNHLIVSNVDYDGEPAQVDQLATLPRRRAARDGDGGARWDSLPATTQEGAAVIELLKDRKTTHLSGSAASTTRVLAELPKARRAHLATHGFFADKEFRAALQLDPDAFGGDSVSSDVAGRNPFVLSGIVLAGANRRAELDAFGIPTGYGGILTAEAIAGLPLQNLDLVTLSACETGLGVGTGETVYGLQRAFHISGTKTVVSSLWKVDDKATQQLMGNFYRNLYERKMSKLDALRHAQLTTHYGTAKFSLSRSLRRKPKAPRPGSQRTIHSWAAWTISGDWR